MRQVSLFQAGSQLVGIECGTLQIGIADEATLTVPADKGRLAGFFDHPVDARGRIQDADHIRRGQQAAAPACELAPARAPGIDEPGIIALDPQVVRQAVVAQGIFGNAGLVFCPVRHGRRQGHARIGLAAFGRGADRELVHIG